MEEKGANGFGRFGFADCTSAADIKRKKIG